MAYNEHGTFLVGIDYVDQNVGLPLQWLVILACVAAAALVWLCIAIAIPHSAVAQTTITT